MPLRSGAFSDAVRVALAWQPAASRPALATLFALDQRMAAVLAGAREPMLAQVRLAWWRERLEETVEAPPKGEPLLAAIGKNWKERGVDLVALVDGWEHLLGGPPFESGAVDRFGAGRGDALDAFGRLVGADPDLAAAQAAGRNWAYAEYPAQGVQPQLEHLPIRSRSMRGIAVLDGLARRAIERNEPMMHGRSGALAAIRLGMFGG